MTSSYQCSWCMEIRDIKLPRHEYRTLTGVEQPKFKTVCSLCLPSVEPKQ
jgi:hypothetical protein